MRFEATRLNGVLLIHPEPGEDERGWFARTWCEREAHARGLQGKWVQCSISYNARRGILRGLHYQLPPYGETKLVRCTMGSIYDVVLDIRPQSPTFGDHLAVMLSATNRLAVYVPPGCAHGFQVLEDGTEVFYQISDFYAPAYAAGVRWDDPAFGIRWPVTPASMSERDRTFPDFTVGAPTSGRSK